MSSPPFVFSLAGVLRIRQHEVEQAKQALARVIRRRHELQHAVDAAEARLQDLLGRGPNGRSGPHALRQYAAHCTAAQEAVSSAQASLSALDAEEAAARRTLVECYRAEEALQTLRKNERREHQETMDHQEAAFLDEQAVAGYVRQRNARNA